VQKCADEGAGAVCRVPAAEELRLVKQRSRDLQVWKELDNSLVLLEEGFTRDISQLGHAGTGDLEIRIQTAADLERARPLLLRSYQEV
jgi:predicted transport protein